MDRRRLALFAGLMIAAQLAFRAWALWPSWFFLDDYNLLHDAREARLDLDYLASPYNGHFMPAGRLVVWLVSESGSVNWELAATLTLVLQLVASLSAWWMLVTVFGHRPGVLVPLAVYLTSVLTFPAFMWWAAALNLVPIQASFFLAVGTWVRYCRGDGSRWLLLTPVAVLGGLAWDTKAILVLGVLVFMALAYFHAGSIPRRTLALVRRRWPGLMVLGALLAAYSAYYLLEVPQITASSDARDAAGITETMLGTAMPTALIGGPWSWANLAQSTAFANPPTWTVHVAWVAIGAVIAYLWLTRIRTLRAWAMAALFLGVLLALLVQSRGDTFGSVIGLEYRYLADGGCAVTLALGLATMPIVRAIESSEPRDPPWLTVRPPRRVALLLGLAVLASSIYSSIGYARIWRSDNASKPYMDTLAADLRSHGAIDLVDQPVPDAVLSQLAAPRNTTRQLVELLPNDVTFPTSSTNLFAVADDGGLRQAVIRLGVKAQPGPLDDCGWLVTSLGRDIPLEGEAFNYEWWMRIGYLSSEDSPVEITAGDSVVEGAVSRGIGSVFARVTGSFDSVRIDGLDPGLTLCVDVIEVGDAVAGGA